MSYGGYGAFFAENAMQLTAVSAATLFAVPFGGRSVPMALLNGALVGVASDAAFHGVRGLDFCRAGNQAAIGAGTAAVVMAVQTVVM